MIVDSSAIMAVVLAEPDLERWQDALASMPGKVAAPTLVECSAVAGPRRQEVLDDLVAAAALTVVAFGPEHARAARAAYLRYGKGSGSPARLDFGDCLSYALAEVSGEPLLFKGDDFTHTDVVPAIAPG